MEINEVANERWDDLLDENYEPQLEEAPLTEPSYGYEEEYLQIPEESGEQAEDNDTPSNQEPESTDNVLHRFLKNYGVSDPSKIQFENEDGEIEILDFDSLDPEEQFTMLQEISQPDLSDHEIDVINYLRRNRVTFNDVINHFVQEGINQYLNENPDQVRHQVYEIDDYTDEELYLADLKSKYPDFTDEELVSKLDVAKLNEELFKKEAAVLRSQYKAEEDANREQQAQQEAKQYEDLQNNLISAVSQFNTVPLDYTDPESEVFEIENADKNQMLNYLLTQDSEGKSQFVKDIENPATLIKIAYYMQCGDEVLANTSRYYKNIIAEDRKKISSLEKKLEKQAKSKDNNTVVVSSSKNNNPTSSPSGYPKRWDDLL